MARGQYELAFFDLINATEKAESCGMKEMGFSHPYPYSELVKLQQIAGSVQNKWNILCGIQKELMECMCVQNAPINPNPVVDGDAKGGHPIRNEQ